MRFTPGKKGDAMFEIRKCFATVPSAIPEVQYNFILNK